MTARTAHHDVVDGARELPGLQHERTALAWQRTALSLVAGAAAISRLTYGELGGAALLGTGFAIMLGGMLFWTSRVRYRHRGPSASGPARRCAGRNVAFSSLIVLVLVGTELLAAALR